MKKFIVILSFLSAISFAAQGQGYRSESQRGYSGDYSSEYSEDEELPSRDSSYVENDIPHRRRTWRWAEGGVFREIVPIDSSLFSSHNFNPIFQNSISNNYLGNYTSPYISNVFIRRNLDQDFYFFNTVRAYMFRPEDALLYDCSTPYTLLDYATAGSKGSGETKLDVFHTQNVNPFWNIGFRYNVQKGEGMYMNQESKAYNCSVFTNYEHERIFFNAFLNQNNGYADENGGLKMYIDSLPQSVEGIKLTSTSIESKLSNVTNAYRNFNFKAELHYNIGRDEWTKIKQNFNKLELPVIDVDSIRFDNDTLYRDSINQLVRIQDSIRLSMDPPKNVKDSTKNKYPVKAVFGLAIEDNEHQFKENLIDTFFKHSFVSDSSNRDKQFYRSYEVSGKLVLNEHPKFTYLPGAYAGITFKQTKYNERSSFIATNNGVYTYTASKFTPTTYNNTWLNGGVFNVDTNALVNLDANAKLCILGDYIGDFSIDGKITQYFSKTRSQYVSANALIESKHVNPFYQQYYGNHNFWREDLNNIKTIEIEGTYKNINSRSELGVNWINIIDYVYLEKGEKDFVVPVQDSKALIIWTVWGNQVFKWNRLYFDQTVYLQQSSDEDVLALPMFSIYSHNYFANTLYKVLHFKIGIDVFYNSKFYSDNYDPAIMSFYNQRDIKFGGYPKVDVFADFQLKRAIFFFKLEHANHAVGLTNRKYFNLPNYPINPTMFKFGLRWCFYD